MIERPGPGEFDAFFAGYISRVPDGDILAILEEQPAAIRRVVDAVPRDRETYRYAPGKWSIRDVVGHIGDTERVFGYRALCIARGDKSAFPGFDEQLYASTAGADARPLADLAREFAAVRAVNLSVLQHLPAVAWRNVGTVNAAPVSVRALAFIMAGHPLHHLVQLRNRYGLGPSE
jgi:hypothetical protein